MVKEISELLREAREEKGLTLDDINRETKIQIKHLRALEEGDFSLFSGEIYIKGALRNYAQVVGINASEIISFYDQLNKKYAVEEKNDSNEQKKKQNIFLTHKEKAPFPGATLIWIALFVFIAGGSIWYLYGQGFKSKTKTPYPEGYYFENREKEDQPAAQETDPAEELEMVEETKELALITENRDEVIYVLSGVRQKEVALDFSGSCWVRILQDGKTVDDKTFNAGERKNLGDAQETTIRLGNPSVARIKVNDLEIDNLGRFTSPVNIIIRKE